MDTQMTQSWHVDVLIPARNEEELLPRCLQSVLASLSALPGNTTAHIIVVADSCTDHTPQIAAEMLRGRGTVLNAEVGAAGAARALAAQCALGRSCGPLRRRWLANTDADCIVPPTWLADQITRARQGIEAIAGTVGVDDFAEHGPEVEARFRASYFIAPDGSHPHIHGANLGLRADVYLRAGGWANLETAEDHDLWNRLVRARTVTYSTSRIEVLTSGRRVGRAPHGFAGALAADNEIAA